MSNIEGIKEIRKELPDFWRKSWENSYPDYEWEVYRSNVAACLSLAILDSKLPEDFQDFLREKSLELSDWFLSAGYRLPLIVIIQSSNNYPELKELAGNQEFLRSQFSIQPVESEKDAKVVLQMSLKPGFDEIDEVFPKTDEQLANEMDAKLNDASIKTTDVQRQLIQEIRNALRSSSTEHHLSEWEKSLEHDYHNILEGDSEQD